MRSLPLLALLPLAYTREHTLFTSSVSYCAPPSAILIQQFDISYIASNDSVVFNVTAASVEPNLTVSANVGLNVYGMRPINIAIDFCKALGNVLCPLPQYNFSGAGSISLPSSLDVSSHVPGIAYKVPDLEGFAQATLIDVHTGQVKACVQTTLSNGWSTRQGAVSWTTGGIALAALLYTTLWILGSTSLSSITVPFLDLIFLFQHIAFSGLLNLNYPLTYISFTLNFSWTLGLFAHSTHIQTAIDSLRNKTGGHVDGAVSPFGSTNRALSPYNVKRGIPFQSLSLVAEETSPAVVTSANDALPAGIATYTNFLDISQENAFLSIFITLLILLAITMGVILAMVSIAHLLNKRKIGTERDLKGISANIILLLVWISFSPIVTFAFYQWTLKDSWLAILLSVISILSLFAAIATVGVGISRLLPESPTTKYEPIVGQYKVLVRWFYLPLLGLFFIKALVIGFGEKNGTVQVALLLTMELAHFLALVIWRPFSLRQTNAFAIIISGARVVNSGLLIPFVTSLGVKPIPRVVLALVSVVVLSVAAIVATIALITAVIPWSLFRGHSPFGRGRNRHLHPPLDNLEKASSTREN